MVGTFVSTIFLPFHPKGPAFFRLLENVGCKRSGRFQTAVV